MIVKIRNLSGNPLPAYETLSSAGMDVRANVDEDVILKPMQRMLVPTGLFIELPEGYEAQIRPRSGLAVRHGITVLNSPGTIDSDYRGEIMAIIINLSGEDFTVRKGDRICQMVIQKCMQIDWEESEILNMTGRGSGGFGHTGK